MYKVFWVLSLITFGMGILFQICYMAINKMAKNNDNKIILSESSNVKIDNLSKLYKISKSLRLSIIIISFIFSFIAFVLSFYQYKDLTRNPEPSLAENSISEIDFNNSLKEMIYTMTMFPNSYIKWDNPNKDNSMVMILDIIAIEASYPRICLTAPDGKMYDFCKVSNIEYLAIDGTENKIIKITSETLNVRGF